MAPCPSPAPGPQGCRPAPRPALLPPSGPTPGPGPTLTQGSRVPASQPRVPLPSPQVIIHRLLSMFHPRPFVKTRFAPQGAVACLTAISDFYYTVMFR